MMGQAQRAKPLLEGPMQGEHRLLGKMSALSTSVDDPTFPQTVWT